VKLTLLGLGAGVAVAYLATRVLASLLYGMTATDPLTFAAAGLLLLIVALAACCAPAFRAARVDPMVALRYE
jgi:ABC-type antimicrobial peptide transport system permease subunit